ncbi:HAD-IIB family hydrolase [Pararobbsia silviterrae]|uniref:HAD-IIB family hydrolase n=1 Tax=Pararobbsia silviterrae TaxID=1792498 RepID=A0A494X8N7_9BURK|nr:HAD-IIB family hydrolase [Pararobbsia silviterrae]RKP47077.1 HAD-IIB family hydrolase [Pararobbsia silviterrae]
MRDLSSSPSAHFADVRFVLTDMDETLTYQGRLHASTYLALERLQHRGIRVIPVTAAPAGWCDQMARMWPVDGVIAENGGLFLQRDTDGHAVARRFWHLAEDLASVRERLDTLSNTVRREVPHAILADDQDFRLASLAFRRTDRETDTRILDALVGAGADATINNLWVLAWFGGYNKLSMALRVLQQTYGVEAAEAVRVVAYSRDSVNDAPMFEYFTHTAGVSTVVNDLPDLPVPPRWITRGPGGAGFVEFADAILASLGPA